MTWFQGLFTARAIFHNTIGAIVATIFFAVLRTYGPEWETTISPVVKFEKIDGFHRDEDKVCWYLHVTKLRWADAPRYEFWIRPEQGPRIPTGSYLADAHNIILPRQDMIAHPVGEHWTRHYCFEIASRVPGVQSMRVDGHVEHKRHPFWTTVTTIPSFNICPLGQPQDGDC